LQKVINFNIVGLQTGRFGLVWFVALANVFIVQDAFFCVDNFSPCLGASAYTFQVV